MFYCVSALRIDTCQTITKRIWTQQNPRAKWLRKEISSVSFAPQSSWEFSVPILLEHFRALGTNVQPAITATCRPASTLENLTKSVSYGFFAHIEYIESETSGWKAHLTSTEHATVCYMQQAGCGHVPKNSIISFSELARES